MLGSHQGVDRSEGISTGEAAAEVEGRPQRGGDAYAADGHAVGRLQVSLADCGSLPARTRGVRGVVNDSRGGATSSSRHRKQSTPQIQAAVRSQIDGVLG